MAPRPQRKAPHLVRLFVGVDPGKSSGGIAELRGSGTLVNHHSIKRMTERDLWDVFKGVSATQDRRGTSAVIERISPAIQSIGKSSMSKLYGSYMQLRAMLIAAEIPFQEVDPKVWPKALGIQAKKKGEARNAWKNRLRGQAQALHPRLDIWDGPKNYQLEVCDSILLAHYARLIYNTE